MNQYVVVTDADAEMRLRCLLVGLSGLPSQPRRVLPVACVRVVSYVTECPATDRTCLHLLARVLARANKLQFLRVDVPDRSVRRAMQALSACGITHRPAETFHVPGEAGDAAPLPFPQTAPRLAGLHMRSVRMLAAAAQYRHLRAILLDEETDMENVRALLRAIHEGGRAGNVQSFKCTMAAADVGGLLPVLTATFPRLLHLGLQQYNTVVFPPALDTLMVRPPLCDPYMQC